VERLRLIAATAKRHLVAKNAKRRSRTFTASGHWEPADATSCRRRRRQVLDLSKSTGRIVFGVLVEPRTPTTIQEKNYSILSASIHTLTPRGPSNGAAPHQKSW
jgi:hypothetical protein